VKERIEEREEVGYVSLQPALTQEPINFVRKTSGPYINCVELTIYMD